MKKLKMRRIKQPQIQWIPVLQKNKVSRMKHMPLICKKHQKAYLILLYYNKVLFYLQFRVSINLSLKFPCLQNLSSFVFQMVWLPWLKMTNYTSLEMLHKLLFIGFWPKRMSCNSIALNPSQTLAGMEEITHEFCNGQFQIYTSFWQATFFDADSVLLNCLINWAWNVAQVMPNTYKYDHSEILFIFTISVFIFRPTILHKIFETNSSFHVK